MPRRMGRLIVYTAVHSILVNVMGWACILYCLQVTEEKVKFPLQVTMIVAVEMRVSVHECFIQLCDQS